MVAPQGKRKLEQFLAVLMDEQGGAGSEPADDGARRRRSARTGGNSIDGSLRSTPSRSAGG